MAEEQGLIRSWLVGYLEADSQLMGLLNGGIQPDATSLSLGRSPFVRADYLDGEDLYVVGLERIWLDAVFHIRGCQHWKGRGQPDRTTIDAIGVRLDAILHRHTEQTTLIQVESFREEPTPAPALMEQNGLWLQSGGIYRIRGRAL